MSTPLATIADALIEFILSLLRDPEAAEEFAEDPQGTLARNGLSDVCVDDVRAVAPVVYDRPDVHFKPPVGPPSPPPPGPPTVEKEIMNISNHFSIDNRSSIVDQSVNQNIWAKGDVNQIFDQESVVNLGDNSATAGNDAKTDNSTTDISDSDVEIGNTDVTNTVTDSFNKDVDQTVTDVDVTVTDSFHDNSTDVDITVEDSFTQHDSPAIEEAPVDAVFEEQT